MSHHTVTEPGPHRICLQNARIVDVRRGAIIEGSVVVEDGRIQSIGEPCPETTPIIDVGGDYVVPGLINCHTHLSIVFPFDAWDEHEPPAITALRCYRRGMDALNAGVTTVRTVSEMHRADIALRTMIEEGWVDGPRIFSGGCGIGVTGGHGAGFGVLIADGADMFRAEARRELAAGADHLKIFLTGGIAHRAETFGEPQMTKAEVSAVVDVARSKNTYVTAHAGGGQALIEALELGLGCCEHGYFLDDEAVLAMADRDCPLVPTLAVTRSVDWMQRSRFESWTIDKSLEAAEPHLASARRAAAAGVQLLVGTDIPPGETDRGANVTVREIEYLVEAGLSPLEALRGATLYPAQLMAAEDRIGVVEPGRFADLLIVPSDPLNDVRALRKLRMVLKGGRIVRKEAR